MERRGDMQLWSVSDVLSKSVPITGRHALRTVVDWSAAFLVPEHPDLGRDGPVCPFTRTSMEKDLFLLAYLDPGPELDEISKTVLAFGDWYVEMAATLDERVRRFLTFLLVLEKFDLTDSSKLDELQRSLKDVFVQQGLMIGQFHPACDQPGLWNPDFRPLRSPVPLLAIRIMVPGDLPFLTGSDAHLVAYLAEFARDLPADLRARVAAAIGQKSTANWSRLP